MTNNVSYQKAFHFKMFCANVKEREREKERKKERKRERERTKKR